MGYELHITRREDWADSDGPQITLDEWLAYVKIDDELVLTSGADSENDSATQFQSQAGYCEWNAHPIEKEPNARPWLSYSGGNIDAKHPDTSTIKKMIRIALSLHSKVQGDDGETYTDEYISELDIEKALGSGRRHDKRKARWRFW